MMSKGKRRVPKLRFPGFTEDWEQRKLGDLMEVTSVKRIHQADWTDSGVRFFRARDIVSSMNNEEVDNPVFISEDKYEEYSRISGKVIEGDLLVTGVGTIGIPYLIKDTTPLYFKDGNIIWFKNNNILNGKYFYYCFQNNHIQSQIYSASGKGTVGTYTIENGKKTSISYPSLKEQVKIGKLLDTMTIMITLHQRKLDNLKLKKKALLQKLFPKNGERYPELRFPGFTDVWEQRKLGDLMEVTSVKRIHQADWTDSGVRFFRARDIVSSMNNEEVDNPVFISEDKYEEYSRISGKVIEGDLLVTGVGTIGIPYLIKDTTPLYFKDGNIIWFKNNNILNGKYFYYCFQNNHIQSQIYSASGKGTVGTYTIENGKKTSISYPSLKEQVKIGKLLDTMTIMITLHQRKLDNLKLKKKALLQKLFPKNGERYPELRFPGFTDVWEQCKLGELSEVVRGASPRPISDPKWFDNNSNVGWLRIADVTAQDGRIRYLEQKISELGQEKTRVIKTPHLLLSIAATVGKPVINYVPTGVHDGFLIFLNPKFNILYTFWWLEMFREKWSKYGQPGSQVNLNSDLVKNQVINIPNEKEQEKISSFLESLDKIITLHQRKLDHLKLQKKALLQQMFV